MHIIHSVTHLSQDMANQLEQKESTISPTIQSRGTGRATLLYCNTMYNDVLVYLHLIDTTAAHQIAKHSSSKFNCNEITVI